MQSKQPRAFWSCGAWFTSPLLLLKREYVQLDKPSRQRTALSSICAFQTRVPSAPPSTFHHFPITTSTSYASITQVCRQLTRTMYARLFKHSKYVRFHQFAPPPKHLTLLNQLSAIGIINTLFLTTRHIKVKVYYLHGKRRWWSPGSRTVSAADTLLPLLNYVSS